MAIVPMKRGRLERVKVRVIGVTVDVLSDALERRNHLMHNFFEVHATDFKTQHGQRRMVIELADSIRLFRIADLPVAVATKALLRVMGISDEDLAKVYKELLRKDMPPC